MKRIASYQYLRHYRCSITKKRNEKPHNRWQWLHKILPCLNREFEPFNTWPNSSFSFPLMTSYRQYSKEKMYKQQIYCMVKFIPPCPNCSGYFNGGGEGLKFVHREWSILGEAPSMLEQARSWVVFRGVRLWVFSDTNVLGGSGSMLPRKIVES